ncbi:hypothetical protein PUN28_006531 [Cardiocondyla obscurior]|uniref:Uncharacterized protein n=1 Tax=Cardiocondyla obscurior TaxID=286306 RepID=A0AAW2GDW5_9HYME
MIESMTLIIHDEQVLGVGCQVNDVELGPLEDERGGGVLVMSHLPVVEAVGRGRYENVIPDGDELAHDATRPTNLRNNYQRLAVLDRHIICNNVSPVRHFRKRITRDLQGGMIERVTFLLQPTSGTVYCTPQSILCSYLVDILVMNQLQMQQNKKKIYYQLYETILSKKKKINLTLSPQQSFLLSYFLFSRRCVNECTLRVVVVRTNGTDFAACDITLHCWRFTSFP